VTVDVQPFPRPEWRPLPFDGCDGVEGKVLVTEGCSMITLMVKRTET